MNSEITLPVRQSGTETVEEVEESGQDDQPGGVGEMSLTDLDNREKTTEQVHQGEERRYRRPPRNRALTIRARISVGGKAPTNRPPWLPIPPRPPDVVLSHRSD